MSERTVIQAQGISKKYRLGMIGSSTLVDDLSLFWNRIRGKESEVRRMSETKSSNEIIGALKDVSFEVMQGDILGIIGKNGAGKSTLLKILSQITQPSAGEIRINGKIASLLEVGTGFHPELSGRENVFLNGAILGMSKQEIKNKFDEIVDFSGVEKFIDTPVKRYSSGMYVRLAFSVAAHLEPDILIVDEVLAVGDAEFQKKCLGRMKVVSGQGRTVLFVSHNIQAVSNLCTRGILLSDGKIIIDSNIEDCIKKYIISTRVNNLATVSLKDRLGRTSGNVLFNEAKGVKNNKECWEFDFDEDIFFEFKATAEVDTESLLFYMILKHPFSGEAISNIKTIISEGKIIRGQSVSFSISFPKKVIRPGQYSLYFALGNRDAKIFYDVIDDNVNIPMLNINPISMDVHENSCFVSIPYHLKINT